MYNRARWLEYLPCLQTKWSYAPQQPGERVQGALNFPTLAYVVELGAWAGAVSPSNLTTTEVNVVWGENFADQGTGIANYHVCVGLRPGGGCTLHDELVAAAQAHSPLPPPTGVTLALSGPILDSARLTGGLSNRDTDDAATVYVQVTVTDKLGLAITVTEVLFLDWTPPELDLPAINGQVPTADAPVMISAEPPQLTFAAPFDPDTAGAGLRVPLALSAVARVRNDIAPLVESEIPLSCFFEQNATVAQNAQATTLLSYKATCRLPDVGVLDVCFSATATNLVGLTAVATTCATVLRAAPVWPSAPSFEHVDPADGGSMMRVRWSALTHPDWPTLPYPAPVEVAVVLCSVDECDEPLLIEGNASGTAIIFGDALDRHMGRPVYVYLLASSRPSLGATAQTSASLASPTTIWQSVATVTEGAVQITNPGGVHYVSSLGAIVAVLTGLIEPYFGITQMSICLGTVPGGDDLLACQALDTIPADRPARLRLAPYTALLPDAVALASLAGQNRSIEVFVTIDACNMRAECGRAISDGAVIDNDDPTVGYVWDGLLIGDPYMVGAWDEVVHIDCTTPLTPAGNVCTVALLLANVPSSMDSTYEARLLASLRPIMLSQGNVVGVQRVGRKVGVSWGVSTDEGSGIALVELCLGGRGGGDEGSADALDSLMACTPVSRSGGLAVISIDLPHAQRVHATICATDASGRRTCASSAGATYFTDAAVATVIAIRTLPSPASRSTCLYSALGSRALSSHVSIPALAPGGHRRRVPAIVHRPSEGLVDDAGRCQVRRLHPRLAALQPRGPLHHQPAARPQHDIDHHHRSDRRDRHQRRMAAAPAGCTVSFAPGGGRL